jgi:hypothetical protein
MPSETELICISGFAALISGKNEIIMLLSVMVNYFARCKRAAVAFALQTRTSGASIKHGQGEYRQRRSFICSS